MQSSYRAIIGSAGGFLISSGLALAMIAMISVEFEAQKSIDVTLSSIDPSETIIEPDIVRTKPVMLRKVEVPPPAPKIRTASTDVPIENPVDTTQIPPITPPTIKIYQASFLIPDRDAQPILRIEPVMPRRAERSGHCKLRFNVNQQGVPYDVKALFCSEPLFESNSIRAAQRFKYQPKIQNGSPVNMTGVETTIRFRLTDETGNIIPE